MCRPEKGLHGSPVGRSEADVDLLRRLQFFGHSPSVLENSPARHWLLEPVQELSCRIDLVVVLALWEDRHLMQILGEPGCGLRDIDKAILDHRCLRVHAHDLVAFRLVLGDGRASIDDQLLDQLGARGHVLDQHNAGVEQTLLLTRRAFEVRVLEPLAQHAQQIKVLVFDAPRSCRRCNR